MVGNIATDDLSSGHGNTIAPCFLRKSTETGSVLMCVAVQVLDLSTNTPNSATFLSIRWNTHLNYLNRWPVKLPCTRNQTPHSGVLPVQWSISSERKLPLLGSLTRNQYIGILYTGPEPCTIIKSVLWLYVMPVYCHPNYLSFCWIVAARIAVYFLRQ